jgi:hypothetical protein
LLDELTVRRQAIATGAIDEGKPMVRAEVLILVILPHTRGKLNKRTWFLCSKPSIHLRDFKAHGHSNEG